MGNTANDLINIKQKISHWNEANKVKFFEEKQEKDSYGTLSFAMNVYHHFHKLLIPLSEKCLRTTKLKADR